MSENIRRRPLTEAKPITSDEQQNPYKNPKDAFGSLKVPLHLVPPVAIAHEAMAFLDGARKYGPYNWRAKEVLASIYVSATLRHLGAWWDGEYDSKDAGVHHLAHARACLAILLDAESIGMLIDDRPIYGGASAAYQQLKQSNPSPK